MSQKEKSGHLAWCALVALALARQNGSVLSAAQESLFLTRWLSGALKQRRFPREVSQDIEWLLNQSRRLGVRAELKEKLDYLWQSCSGELSAQNDLFRLMHAMQTAKSMRWLYRLLSDREWGGRHAVILNPGVDGVFLLNSAISAAFDDGGRQVKPLPVRLTGNVPGVTTLLHSCGWRVETTEDMTLPHLFTLTAIQAE